MIVGLPLELSTLTTSLKVAVTDTLSPTFTKLFCTPSASVIATLLTVGSAVSTLTLELSGTVSCVRLASLWAASLIVLLLSSRASALMLMPLVSLSPDWIVYRNTRSSLPLPDVYVAVRLSLPTARVIVGLPLELSTLTTSLKVAVTETLSPAFKKLF